MIKEKGERLRLGEPEQTPKCYKESVQAGGIRQMR